MISKPLDSEYHNTNVFELAHAIADMLPIFFVAQLKMLFFLDPPPATPL